MSIHHIATHPLVCNPQEILAKAFGYSEPTTSPEKSAKLIKNNETEYCKCCGRVNKVGFLDKKNSLFGSLTNAFYQYTQRGIDSEFMCSYCYFNYKSYMKKMQEKVYGDMSALVLYSDRSFEHFDFLSSSEENALYNIFMNPPEVPFAILAKEYVGNVFIEMGYSFKPTVDSEMIVVNIGAENYICRRKETLEALAEAEEIYALAKKAKLNLSDDIPFNSAEKTDYKLWLTDKIRGDDEVMGKYRDFLNKYTKGERVVTKMMQKTYRKSIKNKGDAQNGLI